ncbi:MAG: SMC-Scp complex subunit ScpB [Methanobacteriota archaeon]
MSTATMETAPDREAPKPAPKAPPPSDLPVPLIVEAALFSAGKPILVEEIAEKTGLSVTEVKKALPVLIEKYKAAESSLEVARAGEKFAMQLKASYAEHARHLAPMQVPMKLLKTLALIAFHQPILQADLKDLVGSKVYEHVHELKELGLVATREHGLSYMITTSETFPEYFGIPATDREAIRRHLADVAGVALPPAKTDGKTQEASGEGTTQTTLPTAGESGESAGPGDA